MGKRAGYSRREFLQTAGVVAGTVAAGAIVPRLRAATPGSAGGGFNVCIYHDPKDVLASSVPAQWAMGRLRDVLKARGVNVVMTTGADKANAGDFLIGVAANFGREGDKIALKQHPQEAVILIPDGSGAQLIVSSSDALGLVYGLTEMADRVAHAAAGIPALRAAMAIPADIEEKPTAGIRSIFRMYASQVEDQRWFYDKEGWEKYFDMLVTNRFNRFNLSFGLSYDFSTGLTDTYTFFMYPFFVDVPGYAVKAVAKGGTPLPAEEMKKNLETLKFISDQAALRGLQFNLGIWTHNYKWTASPNATHLIEGLNAQTQAPYSRDAMKMILAACPGITGVTLRTHGESGVPEGSYDLWKIIMSGVMGHKNADGSARVIEVDMHGKTMTKEMIETAESTGMPVTISCKFWAEHMGLPYVQASIREAEMPKGRDAGGLMALSNGTRSFLRYGIGDLLQKGRKYKVIHRVWPGTQRLLLWGDPLYAAEMGRAASFAGMDGIEYFEPLSFRGRAGSSMNIPPAPDRSGYADASLRTERDWEKYTYTFRLWGRLSYNPDASADTWQRQLKAELGPAAGRLEQALANASRILPLITTAHDPAAANAQYWPEVYVNQSLYNPNNGPYSEAPNPKVFGNVTSLDPQMFASTNEYVDSLLTNKPLPKITPLEVAIQLEAWAMHAESNALVPHVAERQPPETQIPIKRLSTDVWIQSGIGQFFAYKFRAAMLWQLFNLSAHEPARAAAIDAYKKARDGWNFLVGNSKAYLLDLTFGADRNLRRHWSDRLADIDADIAGMATRGPNLRGTDYLPATIDKLVQSIVNPPQLDIEAAAPPKHTAARSFKAGEALAAELAAARRFDSARLMYRHFHQGERYVALEMEKRGDVFAGAVPAAFTNSAFGIQYYFEVRTAQTAGIFPGFGENFVGTPYFVVMPA